MFCTTCGERIELGDKFCAHCGARLAPDAGKSQPAKVAQEMSPAFASTPPIQSLLYPAEVPPRKSGMPVLLAVLAVLMLGGAGAAYWMLHSSLPASRTAAVSKVDVAVRPTRAQVVAGGAFDFAASVTGSDNLEVTWSIQEGDAGGRVVPRGAQASGGKVSLLAVYIAPQTPGTYHLLVTSKADPKKSAASDITVTPQ